MWFPIGTRQEHIYIGFLLTKTQLSPDDHDDDEDAHDNDNNNDDDDDAFSYPQKTAIKSRVVDRYKGFFVESFCFFSNHHPLSEKYILQDLGNALFEYEKYKSVDRSSCFSTSLPTPTLRRQMSPRKNIKTSGYIRSLLRWFLIHLLVFCATSKNTFLGQICAIPSWDEAIRISKRGMQDHAKSAATRTRGTHLWKRPGLHFEMDLDVTPIEGEINLRLKVAPWLYFFCLINILWNFLLIVFCKMFGSTPLFLLFKLFLFLSCAYFFGFYFLFLKINLAVPRYHF